MYYRVESWDHDAANWRHEVDKGTLQDAIASCTMVQEQARQGYLAALPRLRIKHRQAVVWQDGSRIYR